MANKYVRMTHLTHFNLQRLNVGDVVELEDDGTAERWQKIGIARPSSQSTYENQETARREEEEAQAAAEQEGTFNAMIGRGDLGQPPAGNTLNLDDPDAVARFLRSAGLVVTQPGAAASEDEQQWPAPDDDQTPTAKQPVQEPIIEPAPESPAPPADANPTRAPRR